MTTSFISQHPCSLESPISLLSQQEGNNEASRMLVTSGEALPVPLRMDTMDGSSKYGPHSLSHAR